VVNFPAKNTSAGCVKGRYQRRVIAAQQFADPFGHLPGSFVGKGHRQDILGAHTQIVDQVRDAMGDDAGLARPGSGQDQERSLAVEYGAFLGRVEVLNEVHTLCFSLPDHGRQRKKPVTGSK